MRKIFFYLLWRYSTTEKDRLEILSKLNDGVCLEYSEQTSFGNVYNFFIEFVISNEFIKNRVSENDDISIDMIKRGIESTFDESIEIIKNEYK